MRKALKETTYIADPDILPLLKEWPWHTDNQRYIRRNRTYTKGVSDFWHMHRVVWEMHYGPIPEKMTIDHINGNRSDNRLSNLRLASRRDQMVNRQVHREGKVSGYSFAKDKKSNPYRACIRVNGHLFSLGSFATAEEAHEAYLRELTRVENGFSREIHTPKRLTREQAQEIRDATGSQASIAQAYNINQSQVSKIKSGKRWA
jgi:hypothetical protein